PSAISATCARFDPVDVIMERPPRGPQPFRSECQHGAAGRGPLELFQLCAVRWQFFDRCRRGTRHVLRLRRSRRGHKYLELHAIWILESTGWHLSGSRPAPSSPIWLRSSDDHYSRASRAAPAAMASLKLVSQNFPTSARASSTPSLRK